MASAVCTENIAKIPFELIPIELFSDEGNGRQSLCDQKNYCPGHAGYSAADSQRISAEIHTPGRGAASVL